MAKIDSRTGKALPTLAVLEEVARITDTEVDGDAEIQRMLAELNKATAAWQAAIKDFDLIRFRVSAIPAEIEKAQAEIAEIDEQRPAVIASAILNDDDYSADDALIKRRAALLLHIERLSLSVPSIEAVARQKNTVVARTAGPVQSLGEDIANRRKALKLALAEQRYGH